MAVLFVFVCSREGDKVEFKKVEEAEGDVTEEERIADLGRPRLGDPVKVACHIRESMEFKVCGE